jgi:UDP-N-acetylglucosamine 2-epimerase (non-hydrolysing)
MKIVLVVGARPNFMKIAPIIRAVNKHNASLHSTHIEPLLVHTGQHYDYEMSQIFFKDLELPQPDIYLGVGSGTHAEQTGRIMIELEKVLFKEKPDLVVVVGDVNSTLAAALAAAKLCIPVAHVEAGLRSYDRAMPEEINRLLTDAVSDYLFTPSPDADENLKKEGVPEDKIFLVGDVMVDSLLHDKTAAAESGILHQLDLAEKGYALLTLHRPSNVDEKESLLRIITALSEISRTIRVVFPAHPRTRKRLKEFDLLSHLPIANREFLLIDPLGYLDFLNLEMNARFVMTDSGGIQEETTVLDVPCLTLRNTTERPITVSQGTNVLVWNDTQRIIQEALKILDGNAKKGKCPEFWDGVTAERIIGIITKEPKWQK